MKKLFITAILVVFAFAATSTSFAVKPPTVTERKHSSSKYVAKKNTACRYGRDPITKECYEPKEGQFYRDPKTGKLKMKKIKKVNLPWKK
ncbi:MAG: hypothetical protein HN337_05670 [Deltaproteobacteria bacterium]|jgi:hypothetical protein|nr:hypothetical protein [Deltaproteobacteria bacterium]